MTESERREALHISQSISGTIIEAWSIIEAHINGALAFYYCNDDNKIDEFVGLLQNVATNVKITFIGIAIKDIDQIIPNEKEKISRHKLDFKYLHRVENNKKKIARNIQESLEYIFGIRNSFAHGIKEPLSIQKTNGKISGFAFKIKDFKPITNRGIKNEAKSIYERIDKFTETDYHNLSQDAKLITNIILELEGHAKSLYTRIPYKKK
ncbi:MAG: hypothetical protein ACXVPN_08010 [Bacteroidia bacterium]